MGLDSWRVKTRRGITVVENVGTVVSAKVLAFNKYIARAEPVLVLCGIDHLCFGLWWRCVQQRPRLGEIGGNE